ncbi:Gcd10p-domain-containing protein [Dimargaris cristalligena]|uniref:tRNA (adenine(58)-N(1))-methyltransferase non-catalytic subunit TRM6 n=1 Tax=Dimargaris cristalligena TaxID=215637 RepID=A0A4Q0A4T9_9FUNG|nr:Gcd10p-domain-containing protein [Dimargaris cristalligena]|eukprot:RKP40422.1 Gcd10p-domain-containing protein [Dimargaris cristalligena]
MTEVDCPPKPLECYLIQAHQPVILKLPSGNHKFVKVVPGEYCNLGKFGKFQNDDIIGRPFGLTFEIIDRGHARPAKAQTLDAVEETTATNREIFDNPAAQQLSHEEIEQLKKSSLAGDVTHEELIGKVVENNLSFEQKTEFSKAKYIERKKKKFGKKFTVVEPTLHNVCNLYFSKNPMKIRDLRVDTLSQVVTSANLNAYSKILVVDDTQGLVLSAALSRISPLGNVIAVHESDSVSYDVLKHMNFPESIMERLHLISWSRVSRDCAELVSYERRVKAYRRTKATQELLWGGNLDGIIIASHYDPVSILDELVPYIGGSRPIVVYSPDKETLLAAAAQLKVKPDYLNPQITESWMREYQVLPGRTHPTMTMSAGGGYLLTAGRRLHIGRVGVIQLGVGLEHLISGEL